VSRRHLLQGSAAAAALVAMDRAMAGGQPLAGFLRAPLWQPDESHLVVTIGMRGEPRSLDPAFAYDFVANPVVCQITEGLLRLEAFGELKPALAGLPEISEDGLVYTFSLVQNVQFHDGSLLTAADVVASYQRLRDPMLGSPMQWMFDRVETIVATDELEVTIALSSGWPLFPYVLATTAGHVMPAPFLAASTEAIDRAPVGTGPFKLAAWTAGDRITLARHDDYWGDNPFFDEAAFVFIEDDARRIEQFTSGDVDALVPDALTPADYATLASRPMRAIDGHTAVFVAFRCDQAPFSDQQVRLAIAQAVDIDQIFTQSVGATGMCASNALVPMNVLLPCSNAGLFEPMSFQLEAARETLGRLRPDGLSTVFNMLDEDPWRTTGRAIAEAISAHLGDLGVTVALRLVPYADYVEMERSGNYEGMLLTTWAADFPDASASLRPLFHSGGPLAGRNLFSYQSPAVDALIDRAQGDVINTPENPTATAESLSVETRCALLLEAQQRIAADQPYVLIGHFKWFMPLKQSLTGHDFGPQWFWDGFLRDLKRTGGDDDVFNAEQPAIDAGDASCQLYLREHLDWMRAEAGRTLALSAVSIGATGEVSALRGAFSCHAPDPVAPVPGGVVLAGDGRWFDDPTSQTDWRGSLIGLQMSASATPEPLLSLQLVPPATLGTLIPLRLIRCDTGTLVAAGPRPTGPMEGAEIYLMSLRKRGPGEVPTPNLSTDHEFPGPPPCSNEATFMLARAFRWAREATAGQAVHFTMASNQASTWDLDKSTETFPGFHTPLTILSSFMSYAPKPDAETILGMPKTSTLSGQGLRLQSDLPQPVPDDPVIVVAAGATPTSAPTATATPGPSLPGGVCAAGVEEPSDPTKGSPFAGGTDYVLEITEELQSSGPMYLATLQRVNEGNEGSGRRVPLLGLRVEEGVLIGMPGKVSSGEFSADPEPIEYAISLRLRDIPPATPVPVVTPTATPTPEPTEIPIVE
jgi:peptide/nickel transport system substrate-binding protein